MPNYCHNYIKIKGTVENMRVFYEAITETYKGKEYQWLTFQKTVPSNTYIQPEQRWGTKWDINPPKSVVTGKHNARNEYEIVFQSDTNYEIRCNTAWSPPIEWAKQCAMKYNVVIRIASVESGCDYYGVFKVSPVKSKKNPYDVQLNIKDYSSTIGDDIINIVDDKDDIINDDKRGSYIHSKDNISLLKHCKGRLRDHMAKYDLTSFGG